MAGPTRDDDPRRELRLAASAGVDWPPILATALAIWLPQVVASRAGEIEGAVTDVARTGGPIVIVLWHEDDHVVAGAGPDPTAPHATVRIVGRWPADPRG